MKLTEDKIRELKFAAEDMIRAGEKILGMLEGEKVKKEVKSEVKSKPSKTDIMAAFIKK